MLDARTYKARLNEVYARAWCDPLFALQLQDDPRGALSGYFDEISKASDIRVVQDSVNVKYLHIPAPPPQGEIDERDLLQAQSGTTPVCVSYIVTTITMAGGVTIYSTLEGC